MSIDLEAGGALATATLAAGEIEKHKNSKRTGKHARTTCANCNAQLAGSFCQNCGQAAHVHRSLLHMVEEILHGILHFDTKSWRTLPLLVARPGLLTKRYIDGQRVRYVSPLALFLFTTFLMFFAFSMLNKPGKTTVLNSSQSAEMRAGILTELDNAKRKVSEQTAALANETDASKRSGIKVNLAEATTEQKIAAAALTAFDKAAAATPTSAAKTDAVLKVDKTSQEENLADINIETGSAEVDSVILKTLRNPELLSYKLKNTAYKFSFMLIPISLPFLWLMFFWRRGVTMYDHAVFSLYSLSFMSLYFVLMTAIRAIPSIKGIAGYMLLLPPLHMFMQLRETYGLSVGSALWRTAALVCVAGTVFILFLIMVVAISVS